MSLLEALDDQNASSNQGWSHSNRFTNITPSVESMASPNSSNSSMTWGSQLPELVPTVSEEIKMEATDGPEEVMLVDQNQHLQVHTPDQFVSSQDLGFSLEGQVFSNTMNTPSTQYSMSSDFSPSPNRNNMNNFQPQVPMDFIPSEETFTVTESQTDSGMQYTIEQTSNPPPMQPDPSHPYSPIPQTDQNAQYQQILQQLQQQTQQIQPQKSQLQQQPSQLQHVQPQQSQLQQQTYAGSEGSYSNSPVQTVNYSSSSQVSEPPLAASPASYSSTSQASCESPGLNVLSASSTPQKFLDHNSPGMSMGRNFDTGSPCGFENDNAQDSPVFGTPVQFQNQNVHFNTKNLMKSEGVQNLRTISPAPRHQGGNVGLHQLIRGPQAKPQLQGRTSQGLYQQHQQQQQQNNLSKVSMHQHQQQSRQSQMIDDSEEALCRATYKELSAKGQEFKPGFVYFVKRKNGEEDGFLARCTATGLERIKETEFNSDAGPNVSGGGKGVVGRGGMRGRGGARGRGSLRGNATGMHMAGDMKGRPPMTKMGQGQRVPTPNKEANILPNGRIWHHTNTLTRQPLHPEMRKSPNNETSVTSSTSNLYHAKDADAPKTVSEADSTSNEKFLPPRDPPKPKKPSGSDGYAVCKYCGYTSGDIKKCERCFRWFPDNVKVLKKYMEVGKTVDKKSFYGSRLNEQSKPYTKTQSNPSATGRKCSSPVDFNPSGNSNTYTNRRMMVTRQRGNTRAQRMSWSSNEPETVTISSSDEEDGSHVMKHGNMGPPSTPNWQGDGNFSPGGLRPPTRRERMEDASGRIPGRKRGRRGRMDPMTAQARSTVKVDTSVELNVRSVRVGWMKSTPLEHVTINKDGFQFHVVCDESGEEYQFEVIAEEIQECRVSLKLKFKQPLMFLHPTVECAERLRAELGMEEKGGKLFNPQSEDMTQRFIVIIINRMEDCERTDIRKLFAYYELTTGFANTLMELNQEEANSLLVMSSPMKKPTSSERASPSVKGPEDKEDSETSRSPSPPPKIGFSGPIEKLLTFPPPPTKGGISVTTEDLYCLNEGEFLNDVIIDFYLKYLFLERLSEKDKKRTHIFSSFFYKRLTQKEPRNKNDDTPKQPPMIRRHNRVKTWTRHVDVFDKDFIVVPINEHSHWFLAIICFPNLEEEERIPYIPKQPETDTTESGTTEETPPEEPPKEETTEEADGETSDKPQPQEDAKSTKDSEDSNEAKEPASVPNKEIRGTPIDPKQAMEDESQEYCLGVKQACILIFDSLAGPSRQTIFRTLKEYFQVEWDAKKNEKRPVKDKLRQVSVKVPQQNNYSDCGVYLLQYVETFFEDPIMDFSIPMKSLKTWFKEEIVLKKRDEIRDLILDLKKKDESANSTS